jgi:hypothetical protein
MSKKENEIYINLEYNNIWTVDFYSWEMFQPDSSDVHIDRYPLEKLKDFTNYINNSVIYLKKQASKNIIISLGVSQTRILDKESVKVDIKLKPGDKIIVLSPEKSSFLIVEVLDGRARNP